MARRSQLIPFSTRLLRRLPRQVVQVAQVALADQQMAQQGQLMAQQVQLMVQLTGQQVQLMVQPPDLRMVQQREPQGEQLDPFMCLPRHLALY